MAAAARRRPGPNQAKIKRAAENLGRRRLDSEGVDDGVLIDLHTLHDQRMALEKERAREARLLISGDWRVPLPPEYSDEDRDAYGGTSSDWWMLALHTAQRLGAKRCRIMRPEKPGGLSRAAKKVSTGIEVFINGLMDMLFPFAEWIENLQNEGCSAIKVIPAPAHYEAVPTLYSEDEADHLAEDGYGDLDEKRQRQYEKYEGEGGTSVYKRVNERYRVNAEGDEDDGTDSWEYDRDEGRKFFEDDLEQYLGDNPPIIMELLSRLDFVPINPRFTGKGVEVDGIVSRRLMGRDMLRSKGYWWAGCDDAADYIGEEGVGKDGDFYLYEAILKDKRGHVFIAYQVGGRFTTRGMPGNASRDDHVAVICLTCKYGLKRVPVVFRYGSHWGTSDPDRRSIPFILPLAADLKRRDILATATTISAMWDAMPSYGQLIDPQSSAAAALAGDVDLNITVRPNSIVPIYGKLERLGGQGVGKDAPMMMEFFDRNAKIHAPQPGAFGGDGPVSGVDRQTIGADLEKSHSMILEGGRSGYEEAASIALEICTGLGKLPGKPPVSINVLSTVPAPQPGMHTTRQTLTLSPKACGDNFTVVAEYPHQPGENLAAAAQWQSFAAEGVELILREEFRALAMGDPSPEIFEAKRMLQRWLDTEAGMQYVMEQVQEALADDRLKAILQLQQEGRMTDGQVPVAAMGDIVPGGMVAPQVGNPAVSSYAGAVAGQTQASIGQIGSPLNTPAMAA